MTLFLRILYFSPKITACRSSAQLSSLDPGDDTGEGKGSHITGISLALGARGSYSHSCTVAVRKMT